MTGTQDITDREQKKGDLQGSRIVMATMGHGRAIGEGRQRGDPADPQVRKLPAGLKGLSHSVLASRTAEILTSKPFSHVWNKSVWEHKVVIFVYSCFI